MYFPLLFHPSLHCSLRGFHSFHSFVSLFLLLNLSYNEKKWINCIHAFVFSNVWGLFLLSNNNFHFIIKLIHSYDCCCCFFFLSWRSFYFHWKRLSSNGLAESHMRVIDLYADWTTLKTKYNKGMAIMSYSQWKSYCTFPLGSLFFFFTIRIHRHDNWIRFKTCLRIFDAVAVQSWRFTWMSRRKRLWKSNMQ